MKYPAIVVMVIVIAKLIVMGARAVEVHERDRWQAEMQMIDDEQAASLALFEQ